MSDKIEKKEPGIYVAVASCWKMDTVYIELASRFGLDETAAQDAALGRIARRYSPKDGYGDHQHGLWCRIPDELVEQAYKDLIARREAKARAEAAKGGLTPIDPEDPAGRLSVVGGGVP